MFSQHNLTRGQHNSTLRGDIGNKKGALPGGGSSLLNLFDVWTVEGYYDHVCDLIDLNQPILIQR